MKRTKNKRLSMTALARFLGDVESCTDYIFARLACTL